MPSIVTLDSLDLSLTLGKKSYNQQLDTYQAKLTRLSTLAFFRKRSTILVFEGWDAGGKGGAIRRLISAIDPKFYQVIATGPPSQEEQQYPYLWRFWRDIPRAGSMALFDRSWYGRVLVERVEKFATPAEWTRAYDEIIHFEQTLTAQGILILKFWLHINRKEQLSRFKIREKTRAKRYKITADDYRNRNKWTDYQQAVHEMVTRTHTQQAPWILVEGNDKKYARIKILKTVCDALEIMIDRNTESQ